jgi:hypothetical protein
MGGLGELSFGNISSTNGAGIPLLKFGLNHRAIVSRNNESQRFMFLSRVLSSNVLDASLWL